MVDLGRDLGKALGTLIGGGLSESGDNQLENLLESLGSGDRNRQSTMLKSVLELVQDSGGLSGLLENLNRNGLADEAVSWVGTGPNRQIGSEQIRTVLGDPTIEGIASRLGIDSLQTSSILSKLLPEVVNQITPKGEVSGEEDDLISRGLSLLGGRGLF